MSGLPKGWAKVGLGDVADFVMGQAPPGQDCNKSGMGTPFIKTGEFGPVRPIIREWTTKPLKMARSTDVLICVVGATCGKLNLGDDCAIGRSVAAIRPSDAVRQDYLFNFLQTKVASLRAGSTGSAQGVISKEALELVEVPLAPAMEQRRIVAKIDNLAAKSKRARERLGHVPRLVERYKEIVLAAAFGGELTREWRKQNAAVPAQPREDAEIRAKYRDAGSFDAPYNLPRSWRWLRLPQVGELDRGKSRHRPRNDPRLFGGPYPFVQTGEVRAADRFLVSHGETYSEFGLAQSRLWPLGTVCITIAANIAETAILSIQACFPDSVVGFLADPERADVNYVEFFIRTARSDLNRFAPATAQRNINLDTLSNVRVPVPPLPEQREIVRLIDGFFAGIDRLAAEARSARKLIDRLDQAVLAEAFRGELIPQDPGDEPASVLLERIRAEQATGATARSRQVKARERAV